MKTSFLALAVLLFMFDGVGLGAVVERVIYSGDTPLASTCAVIQTGPMELTVAPCSFTTTGEAKIIIPDPITWAAALVGLGSLGRAIAENKAEWMPDGFRIRGWLVNGQGNIIERTKTRLLPVAAVTAVPVDNTYLLYLVEKAGPILGVVLLSMNDPRPANYVHILAFKFEVPVGTTDLNTVTIEVFTVKSGFPPPRGLFEK